MSSDAGQRCTETAWNTACLAVLDCLTGGLAGRQADWLSYVEA